MAYTGTSIVDYLNSTGQASDYNSRAKLAQQVGISGYSGSVQQNTDLLNILNNRNASQPATQPSNGFTVPPSQYSLVSQPIPSSSAITSAPITSSNLAPAPAYNLPAPVNNYPTTSANLNAKVGAVTNNSTPPDYGQPIQGAPDKPFITVNGQNYYANPADRTSSTATQAPQPVDERKSIKDRINSILDQQATKGARTNEIYKEAGVDTKLQALTDLQNEAITLQKSYNDQIERIRQENPTGQLSGAQQQAIDQLARNRDRASADNAIQQLVAQNNYKAAYQIADLKVQAEFQPLQDQLDTLKLYYSIFQDNMTASEKLNAQQAYQTKADTLDFQRQQALLREKAAIDNASKANQPGVISDVTGKPLTDAERQAQGYATRAEDASSVIDQLGSNFTGAASSFGQKLPNALKSADRQRFEQAQRDFVNAVLRKESGAAISPDEFENARQQYFPQPGDSAAVVEQKAANRKNSINSLRLQGGIVGSTDSGVTSSGLSYTVTY